MIDCHTLVSQVVQNLTDKTLDLQTCYELHTMQIYKEKKT